MESVLVFRYAIYNAKKVLHILNILFRKIFVARKEHQFQRSLTIDSSGFHNWKSLGFIVFHTFMYLCSALLCGCIYHLVAFILNLKIAASCMLAMDFLVHILGRKMLPILFKQKWNFTVIGPLLNNDRGQDYPDGQEQSEPTPRPKKE